MKLRVYIPNYSKIKTKLSENTTAMIKYIGNDIIEVDSVEDIREVVSDMTKFEIMTDEQIKDFFDVNFPEIKINEVPINIDELKLKFRSLFVDLPNEYYEETNAAVLIKKAFNFYFIKKETRYIIFNVANGSLIVKESYKHPPTIEFYFRMKKLSYNIDEYYSLLRQTQKVILRAILKDVIYPLTKEKIGRKEISLLEKIINMTARFFLDLEEQLEDFKLEIKEKKTIY